MLITIGIHFYQWGPLLEHNYSASVDCACNTYSHYLDTVIHCLEMIKVGETTEGEEDKNKFISVFSSQKKETWLQNKVVYLMNDTNYVFTALDNDLFVPRGCYENKDGIPIMFYSDCTHDVTPHASCFIEKIISVNKLKNGLDASTNVLGEGVSPETIHMLFTLTTLFTIIILKYLYVYILKFIKTYRHIILTIYLYRHDILILTRTYFTYD